MTQISRNLKNSELEQVLSNVLSTGKPVIIDMIESEGRDGEKYTQVYLVQETKAYPSRSGNSGVEVSDLTAQLLGWDKSYIRTLDISLSANGILDQSYQCVWTNLMMAL